MTEAPVTVRPDATIAHAASKMVRYAIQLLPVVDAKGRLVGELRRSRVLSALQPVKPVRAHAPGLSLYLSALGARPPHDGDLLN